MIFFQMNLAMKEATQRAIAQMLFSSVGQSNIQAHMELHVTRDNIVEDTIRELSNYTENDYKKPLKVFL